MENSKKAIQFLMQRGFVPAGDNNEYWISDEYPEIEILDQGVGLRVFDRDGHTLKFIPNIKKLKLFLNEQK